MFVSALALLLSACRRDEPATSYGSPPPFVSPTSPTILPLCLPDDEVWIESLTLTPTVFSQARVEVSLSARADAAVACTLQSDPTEVHLLEGEGADHYVFDLGGLLSDESYLCEAVAVCPTSRAASMEAVLQTLPAPSYAPTATAQFSTEISMTGIYTLTNAQPNCTGGPNRDQWLVIWDPFGRPRWLYTLPPDLNVGIEARFHGDDTIVWGGGDHSGGAPAKVDLFDGEFYKTTFPGSEGAIFHHDGKMLPDGRMLTTEESLEENWASFQLHLVDPETGNVDWSYHSNQAVAEGALTPDGYYDSVDPWHLNWADIVDGTAVVSLCHSWLIAGIDLSTSSVSWRFGVNGDFALTDTQGEALTDVHYPQCQHGLEFDGHSLLIYDNGGLNNYSRATEFDLDIPSMAATKTWEWTEDDWFETSLGDVDWLTEDHQRVLITKAHPECFSPSPESVSEIVEIDKAGGKVVHRLTFDEPETSTYRADRISGCAIFNNAALCGDLATRLVQLRPLFER